MNRLLVFVLGLIGLGMLGGFPGARAAGLLCGTVRDAATHAGVGGAEVAVYSQGGVYTGHSGATDATGRFCISAIPPGVYDVQVRVDHYVSRILRGVQVTDFGADVDADVDVALAGLAPPSPNPAVDRVHFVIKLRQSSAARLQVFDAAGRFVRGWDCASSPAGILSIDWDLRDATGASVATGFYAIQLHLDGQTMTRTFVVVH